MEIYYCPTPCSLSEHEREEIRLRVPKDKRETKSDTALLCRGALRYYLCKKLSLSNHELNILTKDRGKPYIEHPLHFNVSHARDAFVIALGEVPVGIDIERGDREVPSKVIKRYGFSSEDPLLGWLKFEAHGKLLGTGIAATQLSPHFSFQAIEIPPHRIVLCSKIMTDYHLYTITAETAVKNILCLGGIKP